MTGPLWTTVIGGLDSSVGRSGHCGRGLPPRLTPDALTFDPGQAWQRLSLTGSCWPWAATRRLDHSGAITGRSRRSKSVGAT